MTFFNKEEDVIQIELTPHGRKLLSHGRLKPEFYAFFDDDIIYDSKRAGFEELNSQSKNRIIVDTPSKKPQKTHIGIDSNIFNNRFLDDSRILQNEIGTKKSPAWDILFLLGEISSSSDTFSSTTNNVYRIPQIECEVNYTMSVGQENNYDIVPNQDFITRTSTLSDGTFIQINEEKILMHVAEKNGFDYKDAFEVEVYLYDYDGTQDVISKCRRNNSEYKLKRLNFLKQNLNIKNDLLQDEADISVAPIDLDLLENLSPEYSEYFLDISADGQIPRSEICDALNKLDVKNTFLDVELGCDDFKERKVSSRNVNLYDSSVTKQDVEDCEE